jgi:hypothetical chaperone protein
MTRPGNTALCCGLDFGTSNSTIGVCRSGAARLLPMEDGNVTIPSAVFFGTEPQTQLLIGRAAIAAYIDAAPGRLMRSLKSVLGTSLIDEKTQVHRRRVSFAEVIGMYVATLKLRAEQAARCEFDSVVHGRPVHFVDNDAAADKAAEASLLAIALGAGFKHVSFQFEPIAAAHDFEQQIDREHIALIADIGGGTSDFTVVRLRPQARNGGDRSRDILSTGGIRLGGTDYDRQFSLEFVMPLLGYKSLQSRGDIEVPSGPYLDLSTWSRIHHLYEQSSLAAIRYTRQTAMQPHLLERLERVVARRRGHDGLMSAEAAKIALSQDDTAPVDLSWVDEGEAVTATRLAFETATARLSDRLKETSLRCVADAGLAPSQVTTVFFTGGTSSIASVRRAILANFPDSAAIDGDRFGSVGLGLSIEAARRYG